MKLVHRVTIGHLWISLMIPLSTVKFRPEGSYSLRSAAVALLYSGGFSADSQFRGDWSFNLSSRVEVQ